MVDKIEMSLDDIIKSNRQSKKRVGGGAGRNAGAARKGGIRRAAGGGGGGSGARGSPRKSVSAGGGVLKGRNRGGGIKKAKFARGDVNSAWKHDMYDGPKRGGAGMLKSIGGGGGSGDVAKLLVSNLDYGVSDSDIRELFTEFGPLKKAAVHYDRSGRSLGTADVVFDRRADAVKAIKQYNGVPLDGRPMNIQLATSDVAALTRSVRPAITNARAAATRRPTARRGGAAPARGRAAAAGGRNKPTGAGVRRTGNKKLVAPTAEELDAELDAYVNDMKI